MAKSVMACSPGPISPNCMGSVGAGVGVIDGMSAVFCGGGLACTVVRRLSSLDDSVRGAVGGLREFDGKAFLALEVFASGLLT